jgi:dienelactone hydrolase
VADILLFHHALGLTSGCVSFADELRASGHTVHSPDLYDGKTFTNLDDGVGYAREIGFDTVLGRGRAAASGLPDRLVYAGFSLGAMPAQMLAQTRSGALGAVLMSGCIPPSEFGGPWPETVPVQIHLMEDDPIGAEDLEAARELDTSTDAATLFVYPGDRHLFADDSISDYDEPAAALLKERVLGFLGEIG